MDSPQTDASRERRTALAAFLKLRRARVAPAQFALPLRARRRVAGLRREELALLCGISTTWYAQLESGAPITVSPALLRRLADVLHLSTLERAQLFALAIDEFYEVAAFLPAPAATVSRIAANSFADEIALVLAFHRSLKMRIYGALLTETASTLQPLIDETQCPIGYWLHDDLAPERRRDPNYSNVARIHVDFHREIDRVLAASVAGTPAEAERLIVAPEPYALVSASLERSLATWPLARAS